ncbi:MAG: serine/threonine protein kinase [Proteobacteria bacterium]|nr:serine/threonine protein kinase [Cystobacterineae bacterium]MCL2259087.1 serine/threonine protein kinase [Cystobacterineae bacterium]MCL2314354.1 serine/threonine protein kinase [Pseudomonadota bacterium]
MSAGKILPERVPKGTRLGNYEILSLLGRGGMAEVYRARALSGARAGQELAIKRLLPELESDFTQLTFFAGEADLARFLDHPNIVKLYEVGSLGESFFLVMELVDGCDVGQILKACRVLNVHWPVDFALCLVRELLLALDYAHNASGPTGKPLGIVHCDVSPSNFFVSRTGDLKLGDFGVARVLLDGASSEILGKPFYLSPEALRGQISPAVDLWAMTVALYQLLTLRRPFGGKDTKQVFQAIRNIRYEGICSIRPELPKALSDIIDKAFSARIEDRFVSAKEYAEALTPHLDTNIGTHLGLASMVENLVLVKREAS